MWVRVVRQRDAMPMRALLLAGLLSFGPGFGEAAVQSGETDSTKVRYDSSAVRVRAPSPDRLAQLLEDEAFRYEETPAAIPFLTRFLNWYRDLLARVLPSGGLDLLWQALPYLLFFAALVVVIINLMRSNLTGLMYRQGAELSGGVEHSTEDVATEDLDRLLEEAVQQKKYRLAVRYLYHRCLRRLAEQGHVTLRPGATNRDYLQHISDDQLRGLFAEITDQFEYIWYGNFDLNAMRFEALRRRFTQFQQALSGA